MRTRKRRVRIQRDGIPAPKPTAHRNPTRSARAIAASVRFPARGKQVSPPGEDGHRF